MRRVPRVVACLALVGVLGAAGYYAGLFESPAADAGKRPPVQSAPEHTWNTISLVRLRSAYLEPPLGIARRIFLLGTLGKGDEVWWDFTECSLGPCGDEFPGPAVQRE